MYQSQFPEGSDVLISIKAAAINPVDYKLPSLVLSDDEYHTSTSNDMSQHRDGNIHSETNQQAETYQANWNTLWFNEEVQI